MFSKSVIVFAAVLLLAGSVTAELTKRQLEETELPPCDSFFDLSTHDGTQECPETFFGCTFDGQALNTYFHLFGNADEQESAPGDDVLIIGESADQYGFLFRVPLCTPKTSNSAIFFDAYVGFEQPPVDKTFYMGLDDGELMSGAFVKDSTGKAPTGFMAAIDDGGWLDGRGLAPTKMRVHTWGETITGVSVSHTVTNINTFVKGVVHSDDLVDAGLDFAKKKGTCILNPGQMLSFSGLRVHTGQAVYYINKVSLFMDLINLDDDADLGVL